MVCLVTHMKEYPKNLRILEHRGFVDVVQSQDSATEADCGYSRQIGLPTPERVYRRSLVTLAHVARNK